MTGQHAHEWGSGKDNARKLIYWVNNVDTRSEISVLRPQSQLVPYSLLTKLVKVVNGYSRENMMLHFVNSI